MAVGNVVFLQSAARSGTTYLRGLLSHHPGLGVHYDEILYPEFRDDSWYSFLKNKINDDPQVLLPDRQSEAFMDYLNGFLPRKDQKKVILDLKLEQLDQLPLVSRVIYASPPRFSFILLDRANILKQVISEMIMYQRLRKGDGEVHRSYVPPPEHLIVDTKSIVWEMRHRSRMSKTYRDKVWHCGAPNFCMLYEDFLGDEKERVLADLQVFLGVEPIALNTNYAKQNPQPLSSLVKNYDELVRAIRQSEFAYCLSLPS